MDFGKALEEFRALREHIRQSQQAMYINDYITVGDFTYGVPKIDAWDNLTSLKIGKFCSIAENTTIRLGGEHRTDWITTYPFNAFCKNFSFIQGHPATKGDIMIGNDVWIAGGACILSGVTIGDGAVIGANALVARDVPPYCIVGGVPAKIIRRRFSRRNIKKLLELQWWNWKDEDIVQSIVCLQNNDIDELYKRYRMRLDK